MSPKPLHPRSHIRIIHVVIFDYNLDTVRDTCDVLDYSASAGGRMKRQNFTRDFQAIRRRAGIPKCIFHDLRKSYCTNLADSVPLHVVQELAGHADIRTTRKHYLKVRQDAVEAARRAVEEVLK